MSLFSIAGLQVDLPNGTIAIVSKKKPHGFSRDFRGYKWSCFPSCAHLDLV